MPRYASILLPIALAAASNQLAPIASTRHDHGLTAKTDLGDVAIIAREMLTDVSYTDGRPRRGALLILFDPSSGRYIWEFGPVPVTDKTANHTSGYGTIALAHVANDRLVHFAFGYPNLVAHESLTKANGIDDAELKALAEATGRLPAKLTGQADDRVMTNLGKLLPHGFFTPGSSQIPGPVRIVDITHHGNTWELILQGQWQEKITLDDQYRVTATSRLK